MKNFIHPSLTEYPFSLSGTENSSILNLGAGLSISKPLSKENGTSLFGSFELNDRVTLEHNEFRGTSISGRAGGRIQKQKYNFSIAADTNAFKIEGSGATSGDRISAGITSEFQYNLSENDQISTFFQTSLIRYLNKAFVCGQVYDWNHIRPPVFKSQIHPVFISSIFGGLENEEQMQEPITLDAICSVQN